MSRQIINLTKQTLTYGLGNILTRFITFLLLPLFTNLLTPEEYGLATLVFVFLGFMNIIYHYGIDSAFLRSFGEAKDKDRKEDSSPLLSGFHWELVSHFLYLFIHFLAPSLRFY